MSKQNTMTRDELTVAVMATKAEGRCGSLDTPNGWPCERYPRAGFAACRKHVARVPATLAKGERLLATARKPAVSALLEILEQWEEHTCAECGYPRGDTDEKRMIVATAKLVLDRTGMGPRATLDINTPKKDDSDALIEVMTDEERDTLMRLIDQVSQLKSTVRLRLKQAEEVPLPITRLALAASTDACATSAKNFHQKPSPVVEAELVQSASSVDTEIPR